MPTRNTLGRLARTVITIAVALGLAHIAERTVTGATACARAHCIHNGGPSWPTA